MCVILYKPIGKKLPNTKVLKQCFDTNSHGAGYMLPINNNVVIRKGFMKFEDFKNDIMKTFSDYNLDIEKTPVVIHFRISTQGGTQPELCHPYPICRDYNEMRLLNTECKMALAHNGIISRCSTSEYSLGHWDEKLKTWVNGAKRKLDYNDTMTFIKDYASLVIDNDLYFARNKNKCELLERLCEYSKLAIMNSKGFVKLIGQFHEKDGIYYSNLYSFYDNKKSSTPRGRFLTSRDFDDDDDYYAYLSRQDF